MTASTLPNTGMKYKWAYGEDGWNDGMDINLMKIDSLLNATVIDSTLTAPPVSPDEGDCYIVATSPTGDWSGMAKSIAVYSDDEGWLFIPALNGWEIFDATNQTYLKYNGSDWVVSSTSILEVEDVAALQATEPTKDGQIAVIRGQINDGDVHSEIIYRHVASNTTWTDDSEKVIVTAGGKRWVASTPYMLARNGGWDNNGLKYAVNIKPVNPYCQIAEDVQCATISGGGSENQPQRIGTFSGSYAWMTTIGGGYDNQVDVIAGTVSGGAHHRLYAWDNGSGVAATKWTDSSHNTVGGGSYHTIWSGAYSTICGGTDNTIHIAPIRSYTSGGGGAVHAIDTYTGSGGVGPFSVTGTLSTDTDVVVVKETISTGATERLVLTTDYTVNTGTPSVTLTSTLSASYKIYIYRRPAQPDNSVIVGGAGNVLANAAATIGGGYRNYLDGSAATIGGGKYNVSLGSFSTVSGGGDNEIKRGGNGSGQKNTIAGGRYNIIDGVTTCVSNTISGGESNTIYGSENFVGGGKTNTIGDVVNACVDSVIVGGLSNTVSTATAATVCGGRSNTASADYSTVVGGYMNNASAARATAHGYKAIAKYQSGRTWADGDIAITGDAQGHEMIYKGTTVAGAVSLLTREGGGSTIVLDDYSAATVHILAVGMDAASGLGVSYRVVAGIRRGAGAATTALITGSPVVTAIGEDTAPTNLSNCNCTVTADTSGGGLRISVTGDVDAGTIYWAATVSMVAVKTA